MPKKQMPTAFDVQIYGDLAPYSSTISKARVRIFYRGLNRNWSYITDEFAEKLISTLPYSPVKGIYDDEGEDFSDHGNGIRSLGKAYGIIPENNNGAWERHIDKDGIERTYYCCDVLLWTALYENAKKIPGKSQSMELYEPSIKGEWKEYDTFEAFEFTDGVFLGLQVLGDNIEPCFEGSAFYSIKEEVEQLKSQFSQMLNVIKNYNLNKEDNNMADTNTTIKTNENSVEPEAQEAVGTATTPTADTTTPTTDATAPTTDTTAPTADVTAPTEPTVAQGTATSTIIGQAEQNNFEKLYNSLKLEKDELQKNFEKLLSEKSVLQDQFEHLKAERDALKDFKDATESKEKKEIINKYTNVLSEEIIKSYTDNLSKFSAIELDKELCFEAHKNDTLEPQTANFSYKNNETEGLTRLEECLRDYKIN